jgi:hypothetical protein
MYHSYMPLRSKFGLVAVLLLFTVNAAAAGFCPTSCVPSRGPAKTAGQPRDACHETSEGAPVVKAAHRACSIATVLEMQGSAPVDLQVLLPSAGQAILISLPLRAQDPVSHPPTPPLSPPISLRI